MSRGRKRQRKKNRKKLMRGVRFGWTEFLSIADQVTNRHIAGQLILNAEFLPPPPVAIYHPFRQGHTRVSELAAQHRRMILDNGVSR